MHMPPSPRLARSSSTTCTSRRARDVEVDLLEGRQRVAAGVPATGVMQHLALAMFTREQIDRAMPAVVVSSCGRGAGLHWQRRLGLGRPEHPKYASGTARDEP